MRLQDFAHFQAVGLLVALRARGPDCRTARCVQQPELDADRVGDFAHDAAEGIDFANEVAFRDAADGRVAGHLRDEIDVECKEGSLQSHAGGSHGGLTSGVTSADYDHVEFFGKLHEIGTLRPRAGGQNLSYLLSYQPKSDDAFSARSAPLGCPG